MNRSLYLDFCEYNPNFANSLTALPDSIQRKLLRKLVNETDKNNFLATVAEATFGKLMLELQFDLEYDKAFPNKQTPDWQINVGSTKAICDVYRLGKSQRDQARTDFESHLIEGLEQIAKSYIVKIDFVEEYFDPTAYDVAAICDEVQQWLLSSSRKIGETVSVCKNFQFTILKISRSSHVRCLGNVSSIDIKPGKVEQRDNLKANEITKKLHKYDSIIAEYSLPYLICVYIDFTSGFRHEDFKNIFLGRTVEFVDFGTPIAKEQFSHLGESWTELGEFYSNLQLSGFITFFNGKFELLLNPDKRQLIYQKRFRTVLEGLTNLKRL